LELADNAALIAHSQKLLMTWGYLFPPPGALRVTRYGGPDQRIGWASPFIATIHGYGLIGFTDGDAA
jgi:hypothetical protein